jgi:DNA-binding LytR/AlgR family response regulator
MVYYLGPVAMVSLVMTGIGYISDRRPRETHALPGAAAPPRFLERLPMKLKGAELYAVEAEDHYLRIHTDRGSDLILMRLSDAVSELEGIEGAQTHRSWWVAKDAVMEVSRGDGRATLVLRNGARAPVSRSFARTLRAEGWY